MEDARVIKLFDKQIPIRKYGCSNKGQDPLWIKTPRVNLFVQVTTNCNADCKFCIYKNYKKSSFDVKKYTEIIKYLTFKEDLCVGKLNFTGGEPTLNFPLFEEILNETKNNINLKNKPEITINTNGINLVEIAKYTDFVDSIGLSRHHYNDSTNFEIFNSINVAAGADIKEFNKIAKNPNVLQLRCNLIKGYIDSYEEITKYMENAINIECHDCGFVTLAPNNDYCKERQIDFANLIKINSDILKVNEWNRIEDGENYCQCSNYVYTSEDGEFCKFYARLFCRNDIKDGTLVFDGNNLRYGFGGDIIY